MRAHSASRKSYPEVVDAKLERFEKVEEEKSYTNLAPAEIDSIISG